MAYLGHTKDPITNPTVHIYLRDVSNKMPKFEENPTVNEVVLIILM